MDADPEMAAADLNFVGAYRKLVEHVPGAEMRAFDGAVAFATRLPISVFNGVMVLRPATPGDVEGALDWIAGLRVPHRMWVRDDFRSTVLSLAEERRLEADPWLEPGMVLSPVPAPPDPPPGIDVRRVEDLAGLDDHVRVMTDDGVPEEVARGISRPTFAFDPEVQVFTAYLADRRVGTALAIRTGTVSGVYNVGTLSDARRRGVGTAATWAAVAAGRAWGCDRIVLQSSEMGEHLYAAMGFRTVVRYVIFRPSGAIPPK
jgi:GNAT superfamily N-acetyltransferase